MRQLLVNRARPVITWFLMASVVVGSLAAGVVPAEDTQLQLLDARKEFGNAILDIAATERSADQLYLDALARYRSKPSKVTWAQAFALYFQMKRDEARLNANAAGLATWMRLVLEETASRKAATVLTKSVDAQKVQEHLDLLKTRHQEIKTKLDANMLPADARAALERQRRSIHQEVTANIGARKEILATVARLKEEETKDHAECKLLGALQDELGSQSEVALASLRQAYEVFDRGQLLGANPAMAQARERMGKMLELLKGVESRTGVGVPMPDEQQVSTERTDLEREVKAFLDDGPTGASIGTTNPSPDPAPLASVPAPNSSPVEQSPGPVRPAQSNPSTASGSDNGRTDR
jgi:hypothetical protein